MTEIERIQDQLQRAHHGDAWHGPALNELLADVTAEQAIAHPVANAHSIWELVHHIAFWENVVLRRLSGEEVSSKEISEDSNFSAAEEATETAWENAKRQLDESAIALRERLAQMTDTQLNDQVPNRKRLLYFEIHGAIQHALYHAGQIALLKKML
jgi:uncharacterized damage-inducible protein DinB